MKLINLLNNFIFNKSVVFNILKKIKLFNNILTLNFNLVYSSQNNTLFKNLTLLNIKTNVINLLNLKIQSFKILKFNFLTNIKNENNLVSEIKELTKTSINYQILKNLIVADKLNLIDETNLKLLTLSNSLIKLNLFKNNSLNTINFDFYNYSNTNYKNSLLFNIKLKTLLFK